MLPLMRINYNINFSILLSEEPHYSPVGDLNQTEMIALLWVEYIIRLKLGCCSSY